MAGRAQAGLLRSRRVAPLGVSSLLLLLLITAGAGAGAGCRTRLWVVEGIEKPPPDADMNVSLDMRPPETRCEQVRSNKVDLLFVIDNSRSMEPMQLELRQRMPQFLKVFFDLAAAGTAVDLHLAVVTSDYGAGATGGLGCDPSPGGQRGLFQAVGIDADPTCKPPSGANFVKYRFGPGGQNNLPAGQDLATTFSCMASVGAQGCGSEHQLEATYASLHIPENAGFLRDDALLVIVFLTNEDDCSAPADSDLFDQNNGLKYGFPGSYQCTRYGVVCGDPPQLSPYGSSGGPLTNCRPAPNPNGAGPGKLYDVSRYVDWFTRTRDQGGLKTDPSQILLVGIDAPATPFEIILTDPSLPRDGREYKTCAPLNDIRAPWCVPTLQESCHNPNAITFFGDPAVRLNYVINSVANHALLPICDDDYSASLQSIARLAVARLSECCLGKPTPNLAMPHCSVFDVVDDGVHTTEFPIPDCALHPGRFPCWRLERRAACTGGEVSEGIGVVVDRNGVPPPDRSVVRAVCDPN